MFWSLFVCFEDEYHSFLPCFVFRLECRLSGKIDTWFWLKILRKGTKTMSRKMNKSTSFISSLYNFPSIDISLWIKSACYVYPMAYCSLQVYFKFFCQVTVFVASIRDNSLWNAELSFWELLTPLPNPHNFVYCYLELQSWIKYSRTSIQGSI